jgi:hypothetical protein
VISIRHPLVVVFVLILTLSPTVVAQNGWYPTTDQEGGFIVRFPGRPKYQQIPNRQYGFTSESYSFYYQKHTLQILYVPFEVPPRTPQEALIALNNSSASYTTGFGRLIRQEKLGDGGRQYDNIYSDEGIVMHMRTRLYVRHGNLYTLSCTAEASDGFNERIAEQFFSYFKFLEDLPKQLPPLQRRTTRRNAKRTA